MPNRLALGGQRVHCVMATDVDVQALRDPPTKAMAVRGPLVAGRGTVFGVPIQLRRD